MESNQQNNGAYVMGLDIGTTVITCCIYDSFCKVIYSESIGNQLILPQSGYVEIDPEELWRKVLEICRQTIKKSNINPSKILSLGISVLRNSFVTWNPEDGSTFHNIITWKDLRASSLCHRFNKSAKLRALKIGAKMMYWLTGNQRYLAASILKFSNEMVIMRLLWALQNVASLQNAVNKNSAIFGTVDTWLIWKFTQGAVHATDPSNASVTGLYDPFTMSWSPLISSFFNIPLNILPTVMDSNACFGSVHSSCFGIEIPIRAVLGDQQAATFGENCFHLGDSKCTLGTGTFFNVNTHEKPYSSYGGLYPVVGWKLEGKKPIYLLEGSFADTGSLVNWAKNVQLFDKPEETAEMAKSLESSGEVFFLPPLPEMATSSDHPLASSTITGLKASSTRSHIVRALLEAIAFQVKIVINLVESEANLKLKCICVNGGIANNDFVMQMVANLSETMVYRAENVEMSCLGAALLAGLTSGVYKDLDTIKSMKIINSTYKPCGSHVQALKLFQKWQHEVNQRVKSVQGKS